jgi:DNA-nicking Smr family endonuclease
MSRRRTLRPDEQEIWHAVARTARPLHPQGYLPEPSSIASHIENAPVSIQSPLPKFHIGQKAQAAGPTAKIAPIFADHLASAPLRMDAKTHAKMTRGKMSPQAKIDLHGMTLDQAHPALMSFIFSAHSGGLRLVLVITGKGKSRPDHGPIPQTMGILRGQVPRWLHMPPLSGVVLQVTEAHVTHGGGGALYVYLRRQ